MKQSNLRVRNFTKAVHSKLIFNHFIYINCHYKYATDEITNRKIYSSKLIKGESSIGCKFYSSFYSLKS